MPPAPLFGVWTKIDRAKHHFTQFQGVRDRLVEANRDIIGLKEDTNTGKRTYYLTRDPIIPVDYAVVAGDVIHNLRSALDHLAYALCLAGPGGRAAITTKARKAIQYPITDGDAENYRALNSRGVVVALAKPGVEQALDASEPYKGGAGEVLRQISVLNNTDKHRLLLTVGLQEPAVDVGSMMIAQMRKAAPEMMAGVKAFEIFINPANPQVLKAGDPLFEQPIDSELGEKMTFAFPVSLNEPEVAPIQPVGELLAKMGDAVSSLVPKFERFVT